MSMVSVRNWTKAATAAVLLVASATVGAAPAGSAGAIATTPTARAAPPAVLAVSPSTGLVDGQQVTITAPSGSGASYVSYLLCPAASTAIDDCAYLAFPDAGADDISVSLPARILVGDGVSSVAVTDCRTTACVVRAVTGGMAVPVGEPGAVEGGPTVVAEAPVTFDPSAPLRTPPSITASPTTGLVDGQTISVNVTPTGDPSAPGPFVVLCAAPITSIADLGRIYADCDFRFVSGEPGGSGAEADEITVGAYVETAHGPVDCRAPGAQCSIVAADAVGQTDNVTLAFDPAAPAKPAVLLRPDTHVDGAAPMVFDIVGFTPGDPFTVRWCNDAAACLPGTLASGTLDADGVGSFTFSDELFPDVPDGDTTCSDMCYLTVSDAHGVSVRGPFGFGIGRPIPDEPFVSARHPVTVTPHKGLHDGDTVTVTASGFRPGASIAIVECTGKALAEGASACDIDTSTLVNGRSITADGNGKVAATYEVERFLQTDEGSVDCAKGNVDPDAYAQGIAADPSRFTTLEGGGYFSCIVAVADLDDYSESGGAPIAFEGAQFKKLPWEHDAPGPAPKAPAATPVKAQPAFTG